jgi:transposase-like protein
LVIVTDGWDGYIEAIREVFALAEHLLCRFHVLKALFRRLRKAKVWEAKVWELANKLFKTEDKRTVKRRVKKLQGLLQGLGQGSIGARLVAKLPVVLPAVGSTWRPTTSNAAESFFSAFDRFYRVKGPFQDEVSAGKHVSLFMLYYVLKLRAEGQACVLEKAGRSVREIPLYHLVNRPNVLKLRERMAESYPMAA